MHLKRHHASYPLLSFALLGLVQCSSDSNGPTPVACQTGVTLQIGAGTIPRIAWTPSCALLSLDVVDSVTGEGVWSLTSASQGNTLAPGIRYGVVPDNGQEDIEPVPLVAGRRYWVFLSRLDVSDPQLPFAVLAADARFTP
jgi:hypothetical protein